MLEALGLLQGDVEVVDEGDIEVEHVVDVLHSQLDTYSRERLSCLSQCLWDEDDTVAADDDDDDYGGDNNHDDNESNDDDDHSKLEYYDLTVLSPTCLHLRYYEALHALGYRAENPSNCQEINLYITV